MPAHVPVIVIFAPTATGKTALVDTLFAGGGSAPFTAEVISADSQCVYRGLDIGTAKPTAAERKRLAYHLLDIVPPGEQFGAGDFVPLADQACHEVWGRGAVPLVVGGTGFYVRSFLLGLPPTPQSDPQVRERLQRRLASQGTAALYEELRAVDPASAQKISRNDGYRICRALEVYQSAGRPLSQYRQPDAVRPQYDALTIVLDRSRDDLYRRIDRRVDDMFARGLPAEVARLKAQGLTAQTPAMKAIGYREFFMPGLCDEDAIRRQIQHDSHRYAKRQCTYAKGLPGAVHVDADDHAAITRLVAEFASRIALL